jgi:hypothetical protein
MNPNQLSIGEMLRTRLRTLDGLIVLIGSIVQIPPAAFILWKAWATFPNESTEQMMLAALLHLSVPIGLIGTWVRYGGRLNFQPSKPLTTLLLLIAIAPFFVDYR